MSASAASAGTRGGIDYRPASVGNLKTGGEYRLAGYDGIAKVDGIRQAPDGMNVHVTLENNHHIDMPLRDRQRYTPQRIGRCRIRRYRRPLNR